MNKKRANGEGSIRKKPNGRWEGRYTVGVDPATGKAIQKSVSGRTQAECKEKLRRAIQDNRGVAINHTGDYTVAEWCRLWFETYSKPNIRASTAENYSNIIENHIVPAIGAVKLRQLASLHIQRMYNDTKAGGRVNRFEKTTDFTLSNSFVRGIHMMLHNCLQQAVKERLIPYNPCDNCRIPKKEKAEMKIIPPEKVGAYLKEAEQYGVLPIFYLELTSGLRRGELVVSVPKTQNSIRKVAVPQQTVDLLIAGHERHPDSPYLFMSPKTGGMWSPESIARIHKKLLKAAGIDTGVRFHDLRHTFATLAIQSGVDAKTLASMLGHYSAGFTLDTYTHVTHQMQQGAADKIGGFMEGVAVTTPEPEPPEPTQESGCKIIPFAQAM